MMWREPPAPTTAQAHGGSAGLAKKHGRALDEARKRQTQKLTVMLARLGELEQAGVTVSSSRHGTGGARRNMTPEGTPPRGEAGAPKARRSILNSSLTPTPPGKLLQMRQPRPQIQRAQRDLSVQGPLSAGSSDHDDSGPEYSSELRTPQSVRSPFQQLSDACE